MELLERSSFLDALAGYAAEAGQGSGRLVLVSGESGIGKTALVEAFHAQLRGARWLWGACDGLLTPRPLGPLYDIAAQTDGQLSELCGQGAPRHQLFGAFLAELDAPAALTVAVIEDAHWADEATIDLLRFTGRRLSRMKALVLVGTTTLATIRCGCFSVTWRPSVPPGGWVCRRSPVTPSERWSGSDTWTLLGCAG